MYKLMQQQSTPPPNLDILRAVNFFPPDMKGCYLQKTVCQDSLIAKKKTNESIIAVTHFHNFASISKCQVLTHIKTSTSMDRTVHIYITFEFNIPSKKFSPAQIITSYFSITAD